MKNNSEQDFPSAGLEIDQLTVNYEKTPVLWDISLSIPAGKLVGILGPNGAGKSTLIKAALGIVKPLSGRVLFFQKPLEGVRRRIAYVPQRESVDWDFPITVGNLVLMGSYGRLGLFRSPRKADREAALHYLRLVGMEECKDRQISQLSGGQQQRAFLARALLQEADLYFMDEPFAGIDHSSERVIMGLLKKIQAQGKTILVVHHDLATVAEYFDWTILLNMRLVASGPTEEAFTMDNIAKAYGQNSALLEDAARLIPR
ncbi:metal ABC transporter ATP-binding protein [Simkania negevensis]|uniref:Metal ABC transporter ATP-binding protein n=1 Tax=Simkania negevensis TaxID=83561 RepID=A0ABS3ARY4_9BACT|nr:metal ABC transporter ATP-binding protein [Simkania negevensis]